MFLYFRPVWVSENPEETPKHPKEFLIFATFQPILSPFAPVAGGPDAPEGIEDRKPDRGRTEAGKPSTTQQNEEHNKTSCPDGAGVLPMLLAYRERKPTRKEGTQQGKEPEPPA